jgi:hypothetical protein
VLEPDLLLLLGHDPLGVHADGEAFFIAAFFAPVKNGSRIKIFYADIFYFLSEGFANLSSETKKLACCIVCIPIGKLRTYIEVYVN